MTANESLLAFAAIHLYLLAYAVLCVVLAWRSFDTLRCMSRRSPHGRRIAFVLLASASLIGLLEVYERHVPLASMSLLLAGALLLAACGMRRRAGRDRA